MANEQSVEDPQQDAEPVTESGPGQEPGQDTAAATAEQSAATRAPATDDPESLRAALQAAEERAEAAEAKAQEHWDRVLRTEAEKENARKRAERDLDKARRQAIEGFAGELLGVRDSLELGLEAARQEEADIDKIREGTELTYRMLSQAMEKFGIEEIDPAGEKFNPDLHQAMSMQEVEGHESNTVISVMQKGYRLEERLLRPALVMVAK